MAKACRVRVVWICTALLAGAVHLRAQSLVAEPLPDPHLPGFHFPETEATVTGWVTELSHAFAPAATTAGGDPAGAFAKIYGHAWGLWAALTQETGQTFDDQPLRVFETWLTPEELAAEPPPAIASSQRRPVARGRSPLRELKQFDAERGTPVRPGRTAHMATVGATTTAVDDPAGRVVGFVKFDPVAAGHVQAQALLRIATLDTLLQGGATGIPPFPAASLVVKPVFQVIRAADLIEGRYYALKVWQGPPPVPAAFPPKAWPGSVWLDLLDGGEGRGGIDSPAAADGSSRTAATTYPVSELIHYRLSAADAAAVNIDKPGTGANAGDTAILVAMHVAGRETARWTWQTFWWTPTPEDPHAPSSPAIASLRPAGLRGPARNYAMAAAYMMVAPDQPFIGGENAGAAVYAYNPWIEGAFGPADLPDSLPGRGPDGQPASNSYGVQTNCMSCHARATYNPQKLATAPRFSGARYVDLIDPQFVGTLQVDFLWSVARQAQ